MGRRPVVLWFGVSSMLYGFGLFLGVLALLVVLFCTFYPAPRVAAFGRRLSVFGRHPVLVGGIFGRRLVAFGRQPVEPDGLGVLAIWCGGTYGILLSDFAGGTAIMTHGAMTWAQFAGAVVYVWFVIPLALVAVLWPFGFVVSRVSDALETWLDGGDSVGRRAFSRGLHLATRPLAVLLDGMSWVSGAIHHRGMEARLFASLRVSRAACDEAEADSREWLKKAGKLLDQRDWERRRVNRLVAKIVVQDAELVENLGRFADLQGTIDGLISDRAAARDLAQIAVDVLTSQLSQANDDLGEHLLTIGRLTDDLTRLHRMHGNQAETLVTTSAKLHHMVAQCAATDAALARLGSALGESGNLSALSGMPLGGSEADEWAATVRQVRGLLRG